MLLALVLLGPRCAIASKQSQKASVAEAGCLQRLATGQKDLPPVHICRYAAQTSFLFVLACLAPPYLTARISIPVALQLELSQ